jgi:hypothetical protein
VNATSAEAGLASQPDAKERRTRTFADRAFAALPIVGIALAVITFYGIEAWTRKTPWLFTDEIEWTQISRAIESTGHSARRGEPIFFKSIYAYMIAPFWAIRSTEAAYSAIKYANVAVMTFTAVPTYLLARMLVSKRTALVVALLSICIPAMAYSTSIVTEVIAYPYCAVASWLIVRALVKRGPLDYFWATAISAGAVFVRWPQFATVPASALISLGVLWFTGPRGKAWRATLSRADKIGAAVLFAGGLILFNRIFLQRVEIWQLSTQYWKGRMVDLGLTAAFAFTVGLGILPVIGGLASLALRERRSDPVYRAFAAYLGASIFCVGLYTAVKAAYLSTVFSTLVEERNLFYLSPLLLLGSALVLEARRINWWVVAAATGFVVYLVLEKPIQLLFPYNEAPGFAILTIPTRHWRWTIQDLHLTLLVVLAIGLVVLYFRKVPGVVAAAVVLCAAWMLTSEIATTVGFDRIASNFRRDLPVQLNWVDEASGGQPVTYLGQEIKDPNLTLLTEFWNRSLHHVYSLDGSAPGPGPAGTPNIVKPDGTLSRVPPDTKFILADSGVSLQQPIVASWAQMRLYGKRGPWRLLDALQQVYDDGWAPDWSTYTYFKPNQRGTLEVTLSRRAVTSGPPPGHATLDVGTVRIDPNGAGPALGKVYAVRHALVQNGKQETISIPVARTPVRVELRIHPLFHANNTDPRALGAQVSFKFVPAKNQG